MDSSLVDSEARYTPSYNALASNGCMGGADEAYAEIAVLWSHRPMDHSLASNNTFSTLPTCRLRKRT